MRLLRKALNTGVVIFPHLMCNFSTLLVIFVKDDLIGFVYGHKKD